jgi:hypothetical protein
MRARDFANAKLVVFDIDDTLVNTNTLVNVVRDGEVVKQLNSHDFTHYHLQPGEEFDFGRFRDAREFYTNARPIAPMINQLKRDIATGNKVIMLTARADFNDRDVFLDTFRQYGIDMDRVHVYRAGNLQTRAATEEKKKIILRHLLGKQHYDKVIMYDDSVPNLNAFLSLAQDYPWSRFYAWHVDPRGRATEYHRTGASLENSQALKENRTATVELDGGERRQVRWVPGRRDMLDMIIAYYWRQGRRVLKVDDHDIDWDDDSEVIKQAVAEGRVSDMDIDLQDQHWEAVVGFVQDGVRRGRDADRMSIDLYRWAGGEQFDVDEELERRGFSSVTDLVDHIRRHGGRYVPPEFHLSGAASLQDIERLERRRDDDVQENFADGRNSAKNEFCPVIDMLEVGCQDIAEWLEERPQLLESLDGWKDARSLMSRISGDRAVPGESYTILNLIIVPTGNFLIQRGLTSPARLLRINDLGTYQQYEFESQGQILKFPEDYRAGGQLSRTFLFLDPRDLEKTKTLVALSLAGWEIRDRIDENFADGRKPSRKGLSRRVGIPRKATLGQLEKIARSSTGERRRMAQWQLNMRRGKKHK